jgi:hypothetical protein
LCFRTRSDYLIYFSLGINSCIIANTF